MPSDRRFLDTNVLVYMFDEGAPLKRGRALELLQELSRSGQAVISTQVLQEFYHVATRKVGAPLSPAQGLRALSDYAELPTVVVDPPLIIEAAQMSQGLQLSFWDALILAAARRGGCPVLYSEDLQSGAVYNGVRVENPFAHAGS